MYGEMSTKALADVLGVSAKSIERWTSTQAEAAKEERNRRIVDLYLKAWNTQESIADILGVDQATIGRLVENMQNRHLSNLHETFKPLLYNIWNLPKQDNDRKHFGAFPELFMENLLHYHTEPLDIVFDPFGGGGTTVDICKRMFRRYYVSDRKVIPGRESEIREHDINNGLPNDLKKPNFVFLDPPYWKQAEGKYSNDAEDLGNMGLDQFNKSMSGFIVL
jgi:DNA modification methylase